MQNEEQPRCKTHVLIKRHHNFKPQTGKGNARKAKSLHQGNVKYR